MQQFVDFIYHQGQSVILPALIGLVRWRKLQAIDRPIILLCVFLVLNELVRRQMAIGGYRGYMTYNIGILVTGLLFLWQFVLWGIFKNNKWLIAALTATYCTVWSFDHFFLNSIHEFTHIFRVIMSCSLVVMSVAHLNNLIIEERAALYSNGRFIITVAILISYLYKIIVDTFFSPNLSPRFQEIMADANKIMVIGMYLLFLIGILCLPKRQTFFIPFSSPQ